MNSPSHPTQSILTNNITSQVPLCIVVWISFANGAWELCTHSAGMVHGSLIALYLCTDIHTYMCYLWKSLLPITHHRQCCLVVRGTAGTKLTSFRFSCLFFLRERTDLTQWMVKVVNSFVYDVTPFVVLPTLVCQTPSNIFKLAAANKARMTISIKLIIICICSLFQFHFQFQAKHKKTIFGC